MNLKSDTSQTHKKIAIKLLLDANAKLDEALDERLIENIYDLFSSPENEAANFQREIEKLISQQKKFL